MRVTKRRVEFFSFYDHTGIEAHLKHMAEQGWLLDKIGNFTWHYRRILPRTVTFSVCYFPKASQFDPRPSDGQELFYDLCRHAGWTLAAASAQMQVFYNERKNPTPIDTDPALAVDAIHRSAKQGFLVSQALLAVAAVLNLIVLISQLLQDPIYALSSSSTLFRAVCWPALLITIGIDTGTYFLWRHKALKAAEQGEFLATSSHTWLQKVLLAVVLVWFGWWMSTLTGGLAMAVVVSLAGTLAVVLLVTGIRDVLKAKRVSAETNKAVTLFACIGLSILVTAGIPFLVINGLGYDRNAPSTGPDDPVLNMGDLLDTGEVHYPFEPNVNQSPLLARYFVHLRPEPQTYGGDEPVLNYTVISVKVPALYGWCREELRSYDTRGSASLPEDLWGWYEPADPAPWGAAEAFQSYSQDDGPRSEYLLCYPDRFVTVSFSWAPTPAQMAVVGEKLGGV